MMYSNLLKQMLVASIDELSKTPENYAVHPQKDFTRNRKISFHDFLLLLLTMEDDCLREELYHFFGRSDETPSKAAFYHQRAKLKDGALWELLQIFNQKLQPTLYRNAIVWLPVTVLLLIFSVMKKIQKLILNQTINLPEVLIRSISMHFILS